MQATIFVRNSYMTEGGESAEECLRLLEHRLTVLLTPTFKDGLSRPILTFRPSDGMIFCHDLNATDPIGVLYRTGYMD